MRLFQGRGGEDRSEGGTTPLGIERAVAAIATIRIIYKDGPPQKSASQCYSNV